MSRDKPQEPSTGEEVLPSSGHIVGAGDRYYPYFDCGCSSCDFSCLSVVQIRNQVTINLRLGALLALETGSYYFYDLHLLAVTVG